MKKLFLTILLVICPLIFCGCFEGFGSNNTISNSNTINSTQSIYSTIYEDMNNVASTLRKLDVLYYENYAIAELNPMVDYNVFQSQSNNYGITASTKNINQEIPVSTLVDDYQNDIIYSYQPKYILDTTTLDTTYLMAYIQSLQDLFLITNDITAGNEILNNLIYNIINEALNVKNNASIINLNNYILTNEQQAIFNECSIGIRTLLNNIINSSGFIDTQLDSLTDLRENYYKNVEALNIKYITILNIIDNRIVQLQNLQTLIQRLNTQLLILSNNYLQTNNINNQNSMNNNNLINNGSNQNNHILNNNRIITNEDLANDYSNLNNIGSNGNSNNTNNFDNTNNLENLQGSNILDNNTIQNDVLLDNNTSLLNDKKLTIK